ncbi:2-phospho-L-lactate transferase CofD family protein [Gammaproteobacteria bacterium]|jgi:2-phospho-L-lactate transferase/gluconeogenesis factor (CofD/UPF0052 family)|nr:2-phospho-L-lactate transferase CofD family protein [Gammaproteobacteria bacterium]MDC0129000.1 2-phospho-L-lactate transferase CofD family protein [Gammaproteobacteria bacterium]
MINIVIFSGGRGSSTIVPSLLKNPDINITSIVNAYDDGKSTGEIRNFFEMLGPSDLRKVQQLLLPREDIDYESKFNIFDMRFPVSLSNNEILIKMKEESISEDTSFFNHPFANKNIPHRLRFFLRVFVENLELIKSVTENKDLVLKDCSLMNCLYAGSFIHHKRNFEAATLDLEKLFNLKGSVLPTSIENKKLVGLREDGTVLFCEADIVELRSNIEIKKIYLLDSYPEKNYFRNSTFEDKQNYLENHHCYVEASPRVVRSIQDADIILYSAGTQHSSLYPTYLSRGIAQSISDNKNALKLFITNIGADYETPTYKAHNYIEGAYRYLNSCDSRQYNYEDLFDIMLINDSEDHSNPNYVVIDDKKLDRIPVKKAIDKFEYKKTGKHNGDKISEFIISSYKSFLNKV